MDGLLAGQRIVVTGAARGIGRAVAALALAHGARVVLADIDAALCAEAASALGGEAAGAIGLGLDVTDAASIKQTMAKAADFLGGIDSLVNNAAIKHEATTEEVTLDAFDQVLSVNLTSILRVSQAALPLLERSSTASIVNTLSTQALFGQPNSVAYATAKAGGLNLTRCMAVDLAPKNIRVNAVAPGFIDTRMAVMPDGSHEHRTELFRSAYVDARKIPLARGGSPEDCAGAFLFLLSDLSAYVTGQVIAVDGGLTATY